MVGSAPECLDGEEPRGSPDEVELVRLRAAYQDLLRAISHDLRAPLRHITAFVPLLREIVEPAAALAGHERTEALEFLGTIEQAGQRMGRMIDGLLALSRIHAAPLRLEAVDLQRLVPQLVDGLSGIPPNRAIDWHIAPQLPVVQADAQMLRLLLRELLANSLKFTRRTDAPRIAVSCARGEGGLCTLQVQDNGAGFDMAHSQGLFGLFQRLHPEREFEGVGAGLALVAAVAERHGGSVQAQAQPGQGCTVLVQWPGCADELL